MATIPVKWFDYDTASTNAPTLTGQAGSMIGLLDAVLVNGYNVKTVQSITVASGAGTVEFGSSGHGYVKHQVVKVDGANTAAYNGEWRVIAVNSTSVVLDMTGVADGTESGNANLACRVAPLGWSKAFSGTNKAAYKSAAPDATGCLLRVDDAMAQYAKVRGYESMSDVDTGTGMFPTTTQRTESNWGKSSTADATARKWTIVGDDRFFYLMVHSGYDSVTSYPNNLIGVAFGDIISFKDGDAFHAVLFSSRASWMYGMQDEGYGNILHRLSDVSSSSRAYLARAHTQLGASSIDAYLMGSFGGQNSSTAIYSGCTHLAYSNPVDNGLLLSKGSYVIEPDAAGEGPSPGVGHVMRGELPGYYACMQFRPLTHGALVENVVQGRVLMMISTAYNYGGEYSTRWMLDITGPWR